MKALFITLFLFISLVGVSQNNYLLQTEDGRRVLLKSDYTWEYVDTVLIDSSEIVMPKTVKENACKLGTDFKEPKMDSKIQNQLKRGKATIDDIKEKVANDYNCSVKDVTLLSYKEQKEKGNYNFCVKGNKVAYKRVGYNIIKKGKFF